MESSDERTRRLQQQWKHDRERYEDQRRQDERERARKKDEANRQSELKRHNREIEEAARRERSDRRSSAPRQDNSEARYSDVPYDYQPHARRGGFLKWIIIAALLFGVAYLWPQLRALGEDTSARSPVDQSEAITSDHVTDDQPPRRVDRVNERARRREPNRNPIIFAPKSEVVQALPEQSNDYPPCSATVIDHCISE